MAIAILGCGSSSGMQCRRSIWKAIQPFAQTVEVQVEKWWVQKAKALVILGNVSHFVPMTFLLC